MAAARIFGHSPIGAYLRVNESVWQRLPHVVPAPRVALQYGHALHALARRRGDRTQYLGTFFLRNRPQLELIARLVGRADSGRGIRIAVLGCSIGAEVYSMVWWIRRRSPGVPFTVTALDISPEVLDVARAGIYAAGFSELVREPILARMAPDEVQSMFERSGDQVHVRQELRQGIRWELGDARDPRLPAMFGTYDVVVANDFLCHMEPAAAEASLRNIARLVTNGGHLIVAGVDLDVRTKVMTDLGWTPVTELLEEAHDGDASLRSSWPWRYWGLEPFDRRRSDWRVRYASAFRLEVAP